MKTSTTKQPRVDLEELSNSSAIRRAVQQRLAKMQARQRRESKGLVRRARELRRILIEEARGFRGQ